MLHSGLGVKLSHSRLLFRGAEGSCEEVLDGFEAVLGEIPVPVPTKVFSEMTGVSSTHWLFFQENHPRRSWS